MLRCPQQNEGAWKSVKIWCGLKTLFVREYEVPVLGISMLCSAPRKSSLPWAFLCVR